MEIANSYIDRLFDLLLQVFELRELGLSILEDTQWFLNKILEKTTNQEEKDAFTLIKQSVVSWIEDLRIRRGWGETKGLSPLEITYWKKAAKIFRELKNENLAELTLTISKLREAEDSLLVNDPARAITLFSESEETLEKLGKKAALTAKRRRLNIQAEIFYTKKEFEKAAQLYLQIAEILEKTGFRGKELALIRAYELLILHEGSRENWKTVSEYQIKISNLLREIGQVEKALIAEYYAHSASAKSAEKQKDWEQASKNHLKASELLQKMGSTISALYAKLNHHICRAKAENKSPEWLEEAEQLVEKARTESATDPKELESKVKQFLSLIEQENQPKK
ncbi:MAG: hypothetical protein ACUVXA_06850 [Candidatus Jordarchaeum sp.]|uniref:hypothetical protein n=1 Tax=Candidatus Jordarchaeum sp. TaxID=2823881 RepID=UPI0040493149